MSSIQTIPVEILLDVFRANDAADMDALQLTVRRFHTTIRQNVDVLPTRLLCDLVCEHDSAFLYQAPANGGSGRDRHGFKTCEPIASGDQTPSGLQQMYQMFGGKIAIRELNVWTGRRPADVPLTLLLEHFPSVKAAMRLDVHTFIPPTDAVLDRFTRLETIWMSTSVDRDRSDGSFWRDLFATKAFRRVPNFLGVNEDHHGGLDPYPHVDAAELFDFITDFSLVPPGKPRVVSFQMFDRDTPLLDPFEQRFNENIASIGGQVCALFLIDSDIDHDWEYRYVTNMASEDQKETFAKELYRKLDYYRE
ncbi:hypothetical protein AAVH_38716 [Aphelenchoides avenae]|nr:hypothetical protein AAVH_38716 [Aphelenchus avenae]